STDIEVRMCADKHLSILDEEVANAYVTLKESGSTSREIVREQRQWIAKRDTCRDRVCIKAVYEARLIELKSRLPASEPENCNPNTGAVDLDQCSELRQEIEREKESVGERLERAEKLVDRAYWLAMRVVVDVA